METYHGQKSPAVQMLAALCIVLALGAGTFAYIAWQNKQDTETATQRQADLESQLAALRKKASSPTPTPNTSSPSSIPTITPSASVPSTWKTYTNSNFEFTFKYPQDYTLTEDTRSSAALSVNLEYPTEGLTRGMYMHIIKDTLSNQTRDFTPANGNTKLSNTTIAGYSWVTYKYNPASDPTATDQSNTMIYFLEREGYVYKIGANIDVEAEGYTKEQVNNTLNSILASFQFPQQ